MRTPPPRASPQVVFGALEYFYLNFSTRTLDLWDVAWTLFSLGSPLAHSRLYPSIVVKHLIHSHIPTAQVKMILRGLVERESALQSRSGKSLPNKVLVSSLPRPRNKVRTANFCSRPEDSPFFAVSCLSKSYGRSRKHSK